MSHDSNDKRTKLVIPQVKWLCLYLYLLFSFSLLIEAGAVPSKGDWHKRKIGIFTTSPFPIPDANIIFNKYFLEPPYFASLEMIFDDAGDISGYQKFAQSLAKKAAAYPEIEIFYQLSWSFNSESDWTTVTNFVIAMQGIRSIYSVGMNTEQVCIGDVTIWCARTPDNRKNQTDRFLNIVESRGFRMVLNYDGGAFLNNATADYRDDYLWLYQANWPSGDSSAILNLGTETRRIGNSQGSFNNIASSTYPATVDFYCSANGAYPFVRNITVPPDVLSDPDVSGSDRYCVPKSENAYHWNTEIIRTVLRERAEMDPLIARFVFLGLTGFTINSQTQKFWEASSFKEAVWNSVLNYNYQYCQSCVPLHGGGESPPEFLSPLILIASAIFLIMFRRRLR